MAHERNEICIDFQRRLEDTVIDHSERLGKVERKVDVNENETTNICKKLTNLTSALWGLAGAVILMIVSQLIEKV